MRIWSPSRKRAIAHRRHGNEGVVLHQRMSFQRAITRGVTVKEYRPANSKAMEEMQAVNELAFRMNANAFENYEIVKGVA